MVEAPETTRPRRTAWSQGPADRVDVDPAVKGKAAVFGGDHGPDGMGRNFGKRDPAAAAALVGENFAQRPSLPVEDVQGQDRQRGQPALRNRQEKRSGGGQGRDSAQPEKPSASEARFT